MIDAYLYHFLLFFIFCIIAFKINNISIIDFLWGFSQVVFHLTYNFGINNYIQILIILWGIRLCIHLYARGVFTHEDPRYAAYRIKWGSHFTRNTILFIYGFQYVLSLIIAVSFKSSTLQTHYLLLIIPILALALESYADLILLLHIRSNKASVCMKWPWKYAQHPNYLGEMVFWISIAIISLNTMGLLAAIGLSFLIMFVTGIPPQRQRRINNNKYKEYMSNTRLLLPLPK